MGDSGGRETFGGTGVEKGQAQSKPTVRRVPRWPIALPGLLEGRTRHQVTTIDLSQMGCLLRCAAALDCGVILDLRLDVAGGQITAKVRVVEVCLDGEASAEQPSHLVGVEFLSLDPHSAMLLRDCLARRRPSRRGPPLESS